MVAGKKVPMRDQARIQAQIQAIWMRPIPRKIPGKIQAKIQAWIRTFKYKMSSRNGKNEEKQQVKKNT